MKFTLGLNKIDVISDVSLSDENWLKDMIQGPDQTKSVVINNVLIYPMSVLAASAA